MHLNRNLIKIPKLPILKIFDMISHNWKSTLCLTYFLSLFFFSSTWPSPCLRHLLFFPYLYIHIYIDIYIWHDYTFSQRHGEGDVEERKKGKKRNKRCQAKCTFSIMTSHIKDLKNEQFWNFHLISIQGHILGIILSILRLRWNVKVEIPKKYALEMLRVFEDKWRKAKILGSNPLLFLFLLSKTFLPIMFNLIGPWCVETKRVEWQWEEFSMDY